MPRRLELTLRGRLALATGEWKVSAAQVHRSIPRWGELPRRNAFERGRPTIGPAFCFCWLGD